jgi:hypothetical protein
MTTSAIYLRRPPYTLGWLAVLLTIGSTFLYSVHIMFISWWVDVYNIAASVTVNQYHATFAGFDFQDADVWFLLS